MGTTGQTQPQVIQIRSENNLFQRIDVLRRNRVKRRRYRQFYVEGVASIERAIAHRWPIRYLVYSRDRRLSKWARTIIDSGVADTHLELSLELLAKLSEKEEASELLAIVPMPEDDLSRIPVARDLIAVVLDRPSNHGNLGTIIRSCDALNVHGIVITGRAVDLYDPRTIRASVGSLFAVPVVRLLSPQDLVPWFTQLDRELGGIQVVGTSAGAEHDLSQADLTGPTVLVIGNESVGLGQTPKRLCDLLIRIPMHGSATSLNVACAASIVLYEIDRQRRAGR